MRDNLPIGVKLLAVEYRVLFYCCLGLFFWFLILWQFPVPIDIEDKAEAIKKVIYYKQNFKLGCLSSLFIAIVLRIVAGGLLNLKKWALYLSLVISTFICVFLFTYLSRNFYSSNIFFILAILLIIFLETSTLFLVHPEINKHFK